MAVTLVQKKLSTSSSGNKTAVFDTTTAAGALILVGLVLDGGGTVNSVTDSGGNTYTKSSNSPATNGGSAYVYYMIDALANAGTVTASITGGGTNTMWIREFAGFGVGTINQNTAGTGTGTTINTPSINNTAGDVLYAVTFDSASVSARGGTWSPQPDETPTSVQNGEADEYILSGSGSSTAVNWPTSSGNWAAMAASFTPGSSGFVKGWKSPVLGPSGRI